MKVELIVINYRTYDLLQQHIDSYFQFMPSVSSHLTVIDVDSTDEFDSLTIPDEVSVIRTDWNLGYALSCNYGGYVSDSDVIAFFNADTKYSNNSCVDYCVNYLLDNDDVGVVGPMQYSSDGQCTHGGIFGTLSAPMHNGWMTRNLDSVRFNQKAVTVSGSAFFIKRSLWSDLTNCEIYRSLHPDVVGAFLPTQHYFEETACAYHAQAHGKEVWYLGEAEMIHEWHKSSPVGSEVDQKFHESKQMFVDFCEAHGIDHD